MLLTKQLLPAVTAAANCHSCCQLATMSGQLLSPTSTTENSSSMASVKIIIQYTVTPAFSTYKVSNLNYIT
jgi:hypothetical protein